MKSRSRPSAARIRALAAFACALPAVACGGSSDDGGDGAGGGSEATIGRFHTALAAADYGAVDALIEDLDRDVEADSGDGPAVLFSALARMWKVGEARRDPEMDVAAQAPYATKSLERFKAARTLLPDDARIPSWVGFMTAEIGRALDSDTLVDEGETVLGEATERFQTFTHFVRALSLVQLPREDPSFATAAEDMWSVLDWCGYDVDRSNPDYAYPEETPPHPADICQDTVVAQHNWKGYFLHAGDVFSKGGDAVTSKRFWENARKSPTYDGWAFKDEVEDRIAHAEERAQAFADDDAGNDPELFVQSGHVCVGCHSD